ncbi:MAG: PepSY domain-containing protein, partial [Alistipes sp.]|nr:PepSY domain-containing protein [Alistipes sp.]
MKRFFAKIHLWLSVPLGILVSVICLTGAALVFEQEITRALDPQLYRVSPPVSMQPLPPSQLVERIREQ